MGRISPEARMRYLDKVKEYKKIALADEMLNRASYFILMSDVSVALLGVKNQRFLEDAYSCCYKSVIHLEDVVTGFLDLPYSEYREKVEKIDGFEDDNRYQFG